MAQLLFTTEAFDPLGRPTPGVPILLGDDMRLVEPVCAWLMYVALVRGQTRSPQTWRTYGEALYDWWSTVEANGWRWDEVGSAEVAAYRDAMLATPSVTGRPYARSTINGRLRAVSLFYRWCAARGLIGAVPFGTSDLALGRRRPAGFLTHVDATGGLQAVNELTVRHTPALPRPLSPEMIRRVMAGMGARDRLIVEWAVTTGVRRMEVAGLRLAQLPRPADAAIAAVRLDATKGGKTRSVYPPGALLDRTWAYVREERSVTVRRAKARDADYAEPTALFLNDQGGPLTARRVGAMFSAAAERAGVTTSFHALRHTFATCMLAFLQRQAERAPELNPLLTLQVLLGHADLATTAIYLRVLATDLSLVEGSVDELYAALA